MAKNDSYAGQLIDEINRLKEENEKLKKTLRSANKMKAKHSFKDKDGRLWVACCECNRVGNGDGSCACGCKKKRFNGLGCFCGELLDKYEE